MSSITNIIVLYCARGRRNQFEQVVANKRSLSKEMPRRPALQNALEAPWAINLVLANSLNFTKASYTEAPLLDSADKAPKVEKN